MVSGRTDIAELELTELEDAVSELGVERFHARQIYRWVYRRGLERFDGMTDLSVALRRQLEAALMLTTPQIAARDQSSDGTEKFLFRLADQRTIESVFIPDTPAQTFCVSTQVGCAMGCGFCLTGQMGLVRNLTAGEIAGQVRVLARELELQDRRFNVVLMGMGEPLHNYGATMKALRMLATPSGLALTPRRVTLSTIGMVPALKRLAREPWLPNLAVSLHATTDAARHELIQTSRKQRLADLVAACRSFPLKHRDRITFEYVLLDGVNDTEADAHRLVTLLRGLRAKVNLIPLNEAPGIPFSRPPDLHVDRFARILASGKVIVSVRKSRGRDIRAACGQLIVEGGPRQSPGQQAAQMVNG
ncbi:MAG: 23S rRNA (adenine(2503)-C(2))-methyltransferase RlmN [Acidobacteria bacterium]|jgi:23S rRNA (adenine2503-C2)-methyltransferase|nr:23S rRNA (adenine(2503)-C(2))-methyltransferase RlmN [Acidobacteriota bacterium]MDP7480623.1 23S rRNA (adenine(2503)-C(2))-methyltransferase RlmN [Vicinamibacterales bacterium]HJN45760.1 23S rRNA (adenine(2503)-C(2))-methyltransferase RlmN [Vicinamibacterales bacterium]|tara:strand:+ start:224 stop:1306 length:1083 start_codon:yes stop_codon:yes gene_type:complete